MDALPVIWHKTYSWLLSTGIGGSAIYRDSTGKPIKEGDTVIFRGRRYTISEFHPGKGIFGTATIAFKEKQHTNEIADEISVDSGNREIP